MALRKRGHIVSNIWEEGGAEALSPPPTPHPLPSPPEGLHFYKKTFMYNAFHLNLKLENELSKTGFLAWNLESVFVRSTKQAFQLSSRT